MSYVWERISQAGHSLMARLSHRPVEEESQSPENHSQNPVNDPQTPPTFVNDTENDQGGATITLIPPPSFNRNIESFDNDNSFPDLDFVVKGLEKPLKLHKTIISKTSSLVDELLKTKQITKGPERDQIEWMFDTNNKVDRDALVKVMRFCYGDTVSVGTKNGECCAMIAALFRLQVICADETAKKLQLFAVNEAKHNAKTGVELLNVTQLYPECTNTQLCTLDQQLSKAVLSKGRILNDYETFVDGCLMKLPAQYLDSAEYGESGTKWSELSIRLRYIRYHSDSLSSKEMREVVMKCDWEKVNSNELKELKELGLFSLDKIIQLYEVVLRSTEDDRDKLEKRNQ